LNPMAVPHGLDRSGHTRVRCGSSPRWGWPFLIVARWDVLRTYWDRGSAPLARDSSMGPVPRPYRVFSGPRTWGPGWMGREKCPICHRALVPTIKVGHGALCQAASSPSPALAPNRVFLVRDQSEPVRFRAGSEVKSVGGSESPLKVVGSISVEVGAKEEVGAQDQRRSRPRPPDGLGGRPGALSGDQSRRLSVVLCVVEGGGGGCDAGEGKGGVLGRVGSRAVSRPGQTGSSRRSSGPDPPSEVRPVGTPLLDRVSTARGPREPYPPMPHGDPPLQPDNHVVPRLRGPADGDPGLRPGPTARR